MLISVILDVIDTIALVAFMGYFSWWFWCDTIAARKITEELERIKSSDEQARNFTRLKRLARIYAQETKIKPPTD